VQLGNQRQCCDRIDPPETAQPGHSRCVRLASGGLFDLLGQPRDAFADFLDRAQVIVQDNLLQIVIEPQGFKPAMVGLRPVLLAVLVSHAVPEQHLAEAMTSRVRSPLASSRARHRSRRASCSRVGGMHFGQTLRHAAGPRACGHRAGRS